MLLMELLRRVQDTRQEEFACKIGYSQELVSCVERGLSKPSPKFKRAVVKYFKKPEKHLFDPVKPSEVTINKRVRKRR